MEEGLLGLAEYVCEPNFRDFRDPQTLRASIRRKRVGAISPNARMLESWLALRSCDSGTRQRQATTRTPRILTCDMLPSALDLLLSTDVRVLIRISGTTASRQLERGANHD